MSTSDHNPMGSHAVSAFANFANKYEKGTGGTTRYIARKLILMSPPFTDDSKVLDNATGTGIVIEEIQRTLSGGRTQVPVIAADAAQPMIDNLNAKVDHAAKTNTWPNVSVKTHAVPAEKLGESVVSSNSITHAYMNFGLFFCSDPVLAASHIFRCLVPGGQALITTWHNLGYMLPIRQTHRELYPEAHEIKMPFPDSWEDPVWVKELLVKAGFNKDNVRVTQEDSFMRFANLQEMATTKTELFTALIKGQDGWKNEEAKREFAEKLAEKLLPYELYADEGENGVTLRMVANVAVCTK